MRLRAATVADSAAIAEINVCAWQTAFRGIVPDERLDAMRPEERVSRWRERLASEDPAGQRFLVAASDRKVIGFVGFGDTRDADEDPAHVGEVRALYVHPAHWRRGLGRRLLHAAVERLTADGFDTATLWTLAASEATRTFYEALGWRADGAVTAWEGLQLVRYRTRLAAAGSGFASSTG